LSTPALSFSIHDLNVENAAVVSLEISSEELYGLLASDVQQASAGPLTATLADIVLFVAFKYLGFGYTYASYGKTRQLAVALMSRGIANAVAKLLEAKDVRTGIADRAVRTNGGHLIDQSGLDGPSPLISMSSVDLDFSIDLPITLRTSLTQTNKFVIKDLAFGLRIQN
jgi:3-methyladenine DNA glycosylase Mpg